MIEIVETVAQADKPGQIEILATHEFQDDVAAHDDAVQSEAKACFESKFSSLVSDLSQRWGSPLQPDVDMIAERIPLCGVFACATWQRGNQEVFLGLAHEDRECPIMLIAGTLE